MKPMDVGPLSIRDLLQHKALPPLNTEQQKKLETVQRLDVSDFTEQDVREDIITPLLNTLGYAKGTYFSLNREKHIVLQGRKKFPDYELTLWAKNFWVLEAKKPKPAVSSGAKRRKTSSSPFGHPAIRQALEYAVHPDINAALLVLCDGRHISIFDREVDLVNPVLTLPISEIASRFDELRALLDPWQIWFFEKRRVVRQLNKVFDHEFNLNRIAEFKRAIEDTLDDKRTVVVQNMRSVVNSQPNEELIKAVREAPAEDLIDGYFFLGVSVPVLAAMNERLTALCEPNDFSILVKVIPDHPRPMNDIYCAHALDFLIRLEANHKQAHWLPSWLGGGTSLEQAIKRYISLGLTQFDGYRACRYVLLASAAIRRLVKLTMVIDQNVWQVGKVLHILNRYIAREDTFSQIVSSPARQNLLLLDILEQDGIRRLMRECSVGGKLSEALIKEELKRCWETELDLLQRTPNYRELLVARGLADEVHPTEATDTCYDSLGHNILCTLNLHEAWKQYAVANHLSEIECLADIGSWQAKVTLGLDKVAPRPTPPDTVMADRFFLGDHNIYKELRLAYGFK